MQDIQELKSAMEKAVEFFNENRNKLSKADEIAESIVCGTLNYIRAGEIHPRDFLFTYQEIYKMVWGKNETADKASQSVRGHKNKLIDVFEDNSDLNLYLASNKQSLLKLDVQSSNGGRKTNIGIVTSHSIDEILEEPAKGRVKYIATMLPKPYFWTKPFVEVALSPKVIVTFGIFAILAFFVGLYMFFSLSAGRIVISAIAIPMAITAGYLFLKFNELLDKGLTPIPQLMVPIRHSNAFFVLERERETDNYKSLKSTAIVYEAICGECGDKVIIEKSREFKGRFVGKCVLAPSEHIFSFDHVNKEGRNLRA
ncbi:MAG: hypothetical protein ACJAS1_005254 [Oleiphilaceae bacterium]